MYKIDTFEDLIFFIENTNLKQQQIETLIQKTINVWVIIDFDKEFNKKELIKDLKEFWNEYGNKPKTERPFFLMKNPLDNYLK